MNNKPQDKNPISRWMDMGFELLPNIRNAICNEMQWSKHEYMQKKKRPKLTQEERRKVARIILEELDVVRANICEYLLIAEKQDSETLSVLSIFEKVLCLPTIFRSELVIQTGWTLSILYNALENKEDNRHPGVDDLRYKQLIAVCYKVLLDELIEITSDYHDFWKNYYPGVPQIAKAK